MAEIADTYGADGGRHMEKQTDERGEEEPGVYWVYWKMVGDGDDRTWRANFLNHASYMNFATPRGDGLIIVDQGWYETH